MILGEVSACCGLRNHTKQSFVPEHTAKRDTRKLRTCEVLHYHGFSMCLHLKNQVEAEEGWSHLRRNWPDCWQGARKAFESDYRLCGASVGLYVFVLAHMFLLVCVLVCMLVGFCVCTCTCFFWSVCLCMRTWASVARLSSFFSCFERCFFIWAITPLTQELILN